MEKWGNNCGENSETWYPLYTGNYFRGIAKRSLANIPYQYIVHYQRMCYFRGKEALLLAKLLFSSKFLLFIITQSLPQSFQHREIGAMPISWTRKAKNHYGGIKEVGEEELNHIEDK
jgi:hypothetical protein